MAKLYATSPNGTAKSINLETMNCEGEYVSAVTASWYRFPNGMTIMKGTSSSGVRNSDNSCTITLPISYGGGWGWYSCVITPAPSSRGYRSCSISIGTGDYLNSKFTASIFDLSGSIIGTGFNWITMA